MSCTFPGQDIEALVQNELTEARAAEVSAHLAECSACADEEQWLRLELAAFEARRDQAPAADDLWAGVEAAITAESTGDAAPAAVTAPRSARLLWFGSGFAAAAAAAVLFIALRPATTPEPRVITKIVERTAPSVPAPSKAGVLISAGHADMNQAERQYLAALDRLKSEYRKRHFKRNPELVRAYEDAMSQNLQRLRAARAAAEYDTDGRLRVLEAYATYVRTLQAAVEGMDI